jgi:hypothetical protein
MRLRCAPVCIASFLADTRIENTNKQDQPLVLPCLAAWHVCQFGCMLGCVVLCIYLSWCMETVC